MPRLWFQASPFFRSFFLSDLWHLATGGILLTLLMRAQTPPWAGILSESIPRALADAPFALTVGCAVILYELGAYSLHPLLRCHDRFWEPHKVHHSSRTLDWLATFGAHILEHMLRNLVSPVLPFARRSRREQETSKAVAWGVLFWWVVASCVH